MSKLLPLSLCEHPLWPELAPFIRIEKPRKKGETHKPSARIELDRWTPTSLRTKALRLEVACARCGAKIAPFRQRERGTGRADARHIYVAVACSFPKLGCSRSGAASSAVECIEREVKKVRRVMQQLGLFT